MSSKAWNSSLPARREPMGRGKGSKPKARNWQRRTTELKRTPLKKISKSQRRKLAEYHPIHSKFLKENPKCQICIARKIEPPKWSTEVHHKFGRANKLLTDVRGFIASCFACRDFPHSHPKEARELGILGAASLWNIPIDKH